MPDTRRHRGPHPSDAHLFSASRRTPLQQACRDLSWLLGRGYSEVAALKLVGDRHGLRERQRRAIGRSAASDTQVAERSRRRIAPTELAGHTLLIDGLNCLITVEAMLAGAVLLRGRDGWLRDLASVHGSYRPVVETDPALALLGELLGRAGSPPAIWYIDRPVSNSGRLAQRVRDAAAAAGWPWQAQLVMNPDRALVEAQDDAVVASSDSWVLDHAARVVDLPGAVADRRAGLDIIDLCREPAASADG